MRKAAFFVLGAELPLLQGFLLATHSFPSRQFSPSTIPRYYGPDDDLAGGTNSSGNLGSYLLQLKETETLLNNTNMNETAVELDPVDYHKPKKAPATPEDPPPELSSMDRETARELDDSIYNVIGSETPKILKLDSQYQKETGDTAPELPLSRPEHYLDRIDRDRRHLAVSITSSIEDASQWRLFCQERGGIFPLLQTIREGAAHYGNENDRDETFNAACSACRAIRDLCAISPEQAAVITDSILRANAYWKGGLFEDFRTILKDAKDFSEPAPKKRFILRLRKRREARSRCKLYVTQLLLAMTVASDDAISAIRETEGLSDAILHCSSYARKEQTRRWLRYPGEIVKWLWKTNKKENNVRRPFLEAANVANDLNGQLQMSANQILAAIGCNKWIPKIPGQKGLRILCLDGGGSRGMVAVTALKYIVDYLNNGADVADSFDMIVGTSTGGIIAFLVGLQRETSAQAVQRYEQLINKIFVKSALSTPLMVFTTASYDESHFMGILLDILKEESMLDSRANPAVPLVCALSSKMSSTPTHVALFRNYNYGGGELADPFTIDPDFAREDLDLPLSLESDVIRSGTYARKKSVATSPGSNTGSGSRHPGSFRVLQRYALRASTAAPTVFKPVMMGGEMYCDGGIVASNPSAVAIHEARALFPDIPIELVVSVGTGAFIEQKAAPRVGWDGIIGQIVNSATDAEQVHHILSDILGQSAVLGEKSSALSKTRYFRFNPVLGLPPDFPIDVTDPEKLRQLREITYDYLAEPEQQEKLARVADILNGQGGKRRRLKRYFSRARQ